MTQIHTGLELLVLLRQLLQLLLGCFHGKYTLSARCPDEQKSGCLDTFFVSPVPFAALAGHQNPSAVVPLAVGINTANKHSLALSPFLIINKRQSLHAALLLFPLKVVFLKIFDNFSGRFVSLHRICLYLSG